MRSGLIMMNCRIAFAVTLTAFAATGIHLPHNDPLKSLRATRSSPWLPQSFDTMTGTRFVSVGWQSALCRVSPGFRATASTILNEQGWKPDAIERQLAHAERNKIRAAYHRSEYLAERKKMMQHWADYLDGLRPGTKVIAGSFGKNWNN